MTRTTVGAIDIEANVDLSNVLQRLKRLERETKSTATRSSKNLQRLTSTIAGVAKGLGIAGVAALGTAAGFAAMAQRAFDVAENLQDAANKIGIGVERLQALQFAANQNGASFRDIEDALTRLQRRLGEFANTAGGPAAGGMADLGREVEAALLATSDAGERFDIIVEALSKFEDQSRVAAVASKFFGDDAGPRLAALISQGSAAISDLENKARSLGFVMDEDLVGAAAAANAEFRALAQGLQRQLVSAIVQAAPLIRDLSRQFAEIIPAIIETTARILDFVGAVNLPVNLQVGDLRQDLAEIDREIEVLRERAERPGRSGVQAGRTLRAELERRAKIVAELEDALDLQAERAEAIRQRLDAPIETPTLGGVGGTLSSDGSGGGSGSLRPSFDDLASSAFRSVEALQQQAVALGLAGEEARAYEATQALIAQAQASGIELTEEQTQQLEQIGKFYGANAEKLERLRRAQEILIEADRAGETEDEKRARRLRELIDLEEEFTRILGSRAAAEERLKGLRAELTAETDQWAEANRQLADELSKIGDKVVAEVAASFGEFAVQLSRGESAADGFAASIGQLGEQLIELVLRQLVATAVSLALLAALSGNFPLAAYYFAIAGAALAVSAAVGAARRETGNVDERETGGVSGTSGPQSRLAARERGGPVQRGQAYLVGERGPEIVVPESAGAVIPNSGLRAMGEKTPDVTVVMNVPPNVGPAVRAEILNARGLLRDSAAAGVAQRVKTDPAYRRALR